MASETKVCNRCKESKSVSEFGRGLDKRTGRKYVRSRCKKCATLDVKDYKNRLGDEYLRQRKEIKKKRRLKDPALFHIQERISMWKKRDAASDLTVEYLVKLWEDQQGCCYYTGVPMTPGAKGTARLDSASLDKLDPNAGYRQGNVVWATHLANTSKGPRNEAEFYEFCRLVVSHSRSRVEGRSRKVIDEHVHS